MSALFDVSAAMGCSSNLFGDASNPLIVRVPLHLVQPRWNGWNFSVIRCFNGRGLFIKLIWRCVGFVGR
jgi:hypothetical protein